MMVLSAGWNDCCLVRIGEVENLADSFVSSEIDEHECRCLDL